MNSTSPRTPAVDFFDINKDADYLHQMRASLLIISKRKRPDIQVDMEFFYIILKEPNKSIYKKLCHLG